MYLNFRIGMNEFDHRSFFYRCLRSSSEEDLKIPRPERAVL